MVPRGQTGNVTLFLILGLFLLGLGGGIYFIFSPGAVDETNRLAKDARAAYDEAVARLDKALNDPRSFDASLEHNAANFSCLFSGDGNCRNKGGTFLLFEAGGANHPLSQLANDAGTDANGSPCRGFPSRECPLRVETVWEPVCAGTTCEATRSARVKAKVTLSPIYGGEAPLEWKRDALFSPQIQLSQAAQCARNGGEWAGTECLTPAQVAERRIASSGGGRAEPAPAEAPPPPAEIPQPVAPPVYECPNQIVVQGQYYPVQFLAADRGQVTVQAMSCPASGAVDVFVFQCSAKNPASFPNEGQWIQVEAVMAPACDSEGRPAGNLPVRF